MMSASWMGEVFWKERVMFGGTLQITKMQHQNSTRDAPNYISPATAANKQAEHKSHVTVSHGNNLGLPSGLYFHTGNDYSFNR